MLRCDTLELNVSGAFDLGGDVASAGSVYFHQDTTGTGVYNSGMVNSLGNATVTSGVATKDVSTVGWSGPQTIFAVADCASGTISQPVAIVVLPDLGPVVDGITVTSSVGNVAPTASDQFVSPEGAVFDEGDFVSLTTTPGSLAVNFTATETWKSGTGLYGVSHIRFTVVPNGAIELRLLWRLHGGHRIQL